MRRTRALGQLCRAALTCSLASTAHFARTAPTDSAWPSLLHVNSIDYEKPAFEKKINEFYDSGDYPLVDGYAPFCKHLFVPNFVGDSITVPYLEITPENESLLRSGYDARKPEELAVLVRWFPAETAPPPAAATYLDIILYSREQIRKEAEAMGRADNGETAPWGIISVKAQTVDYELPMQPSARARATSPTRALTRHAVVPSDHEDRGVMAGRIWQQPSPPPRVSSCASRAAHSHDDAQRAGQGGGRQRRATRARKVHGVGGLLVQVREHQVKRACFAMRGSVVGGADPGTSLWRASMKSAQKYWRRLVWDR